MRINVSKTEVMKICDDLTPIQVSVNGVSLHEVNSFKYLGAVFNTDTRCDLEVKGRLSHATERLGKLKVLWKRRSISNRLKAKLIK